MHRLGSVDFRYQGTAFLSLSIDSRQVVVPPFTRVDEGDEVVIGHPADSRFLAVSKPVVEVLEHLAAGHGIAETATWLREVQGADVDLDALLRTLAERGFVEMQSEDGEAPVGTRERQRAHRFHFTGFPVPVARALFGPVALAIYSLLIAGGIAVVVARPQIVPGWRALFFPQQFLQLISLLLVHHLVATFVHEMAHLVAARAVGVSSRLGISHRLWYLVAETDMTGVWALPRRRRFLPLVAGPLIDAVSAALLLVLLFLVDRGTVALAPTPRILIEAMTLRYLLGLVWQCYFFLRTDFYYVLANLVRAKNLMRDTEDYLRSKVAWLPARKGQGDPSRLSRGERMAVRGYAAVWAVGRLAALGVLVFIQLPLALSYLREILHPTSSLGPDHVVLLLTSLVGTIAGLWLWVRNLVKEHRTS